MRSYRFLAPLALSLCSWAQAGPPADIVLDPMVVTAVRDDAPASKTPASVTVITRADIERLQPRDLADLLRSLPGVTVAQNGGRGQLTSVFLRGHESRHTLVLIDGHRAGTVELPGFSFEYLPVDVIERIELVQGPRSTLYGSQAFGGVLQIFTRRGAETTLRLHGGTQGAAGLSGHTGWKSASGYTATLDVGLESATGYDATTPAAFGANPDDDGFRTKNIGAHLAAPLGDALRLRANGQRSEGRTKFDSEFNDFIQEQYSAGAEWKVLTRTQLALDAGYTRERRDFDFGFGPGFFTDSQRMTADLKLTQDFADGSALIAGLDFADDRFRSQGAANNGQRTRAAYTLLRPRFGDLSLELGGRFETGDSAKDVFTAQGGMRYALTRELDVYVNGGSGFRAPTFQERFGGPFNIANPNLRPEETEGYEVGAAWRGGGYKIEAAGFYSYVRNLIDFTLGANGVFDFPLVDDIYANVARTRISGGELRAEARIWDTRIGLGYNYTDARNAATRAPLSRRPKQTARLDLDRRWQRLNYGVTLQAEDGRPDGGVRVPGFVLLNLRTSFDQTPALSWDASLINALDHDYTTVNTFRNNPLTVRVGVTWRPAL